ncbi:Beta-galactosidase [Mariniphaga anaerophila]|uniref:Beta-galactosidase n=1 Tax=Mariniphaga anaerophila TaxID=1484053 RepID=A0A1M5E795_9BACT|nr:beta-galactosidase [Mariniphaga anaerophila]SHF75056.1 Beta-galactosidase [Mariniphaga anaerophila]
MNRFFEIKYTLILVGGIMCFINSMAQIRATNADGYDVLCLGELPVGLWVTPPDEFRNDKQYRRIAKSGINFVNGFGFYENNVEDINSSLDLCAKYGMKYFVNRGIVHEAILSYAEKADKNLVNDMLNAAKRYKDHPAYAGELLMDEPGKPLFQAVAAFTKQFESLYPEKMWHVNLFPTYATGGIQTHSYEDYIDSWLELIQPRYLSYDSYPLLKSGGIVTDYFYNLDLIRKKTLDKNIPFWTFIQTLSIARTPGVPDKREPNEEEIRWQVWSNLAFGAKGIQYFCYWSPGNGKETFSNALVTQKGEKTKKYDYVKRLNSDIKKTGEILLGCDAFGVIQTAQEPFPLYGKPIKSFGPVESVSGDDSIAGCFIDEIGNYRVLLMALLPGKGATVKVSLDENVQYVTLIEGTKEKRVKVNNQQLTQFIADGEAVLVEF